MTTEEIKAELEEVSDTIYTLEIRKLELEKILLDSIDDIAEKFEQWKYSSDKQHCDDFGELETKCPLFAASIGQELHRHKTYDILDRWEQFEYVFSFDEKKENIPYYLANLDVEKWKEIALELMNANVGSFEYDW